MNTTLLLGLAFVASAPGLKDRSKAPPLVGEWVAEAITHNGQADAEPATLQYTFTAEGGWIVVRKGTKIGATDRGYRVDPTAEPPSIDFTLDRARGDTDRLLGIFRLEGDTLTLCLAMEGKPRPREFASPVGSQFSLIVLKRVKPKD